MNWRTNLTVATRPASVFPTLLAARPSPIALTLAPAKWGRLARASTLLLFATVVLIATVLTHGPAPVSADTATITNPVTSTDGDYSGITADSVSVAVRDSGHLRTLIQTNSDPVNPNPRPQPQAEPTATPTPEEEPPEPQGSEDPEDPVEPEEPREPEESEESQESQEPEEPVEPSPESEREAEPESAADTGEAAAEPDTGTGLGSDQVTVSAFLLVVLLVGAGLAFSYRRR